MKAIILAAGIASRLRPLTDNTPKCLLKVGQKNILALTLDHIVANKIKDVIIVTGYLQEQITAFVNSHYPQLDVSFIYNEVYDSTNNIYSLWLTKEHMTGEDMLLMDSDIIFDEEIIRRLVHSPHANCLALKRHAVGEEEIKVKVDSSGRIEQIGKTILPSEALGESIGIEKFNAKLVSKLFAVLDQKIILEKEVNIFYEAAFQDLMNAGEDIYVVDVTDCTCMEIDTVDDLNLANQIHTL